MYMNMCWIYICVDGFGRWQLTDYTRPVYVYTCYTYVDIYILYTLVCNRYMRRQIRTMATDLLEKTDLFNLREEHSGWLLKESSGDVCMIYNILYIYIN